MSGTCLIVHTRPAEKYVILTEMLHYFVRHLEFT